MHDSCIDLLYTKTPSMPIMRKSWCALIAALTLFLQFSCGPTHVVVESSTPPPPPPPPPAETAPAPEATYQSFYDALAPYGEWINDPEYGYVWMPNAGPEFKPYATNGNWVYTEDGWTWASNYPWGWAAFHYGRWFYEEGYGWMWIPGSEWAPAWVSWRQSPEYFGWAPLGPSVSINVAEGGGYNPPPHYWCFVPQRYVTSPYVTNYYVNERQNVTIINNTTVIHRTTIINNNVNNTTIINNRRVNDYAGGPDPREVTRVTGAQLHPVAMRTSNTPGENRSAAMFAIYRPHINATPQSDGRTEARPAPMRVQAINNVRPVNTTIYTNNGRYNNNRWPGNNPGNPAFNNNRSDNTNINNNRSTVQPYSSQPGNPPSGQPVAQPGRQPGFQPWNRPGNQQGNQAGNQPGNQTGNQPGTQPGNSQANQQGYPQGNQPGAQGQPGGQGQPAARPGQLQPGFRPFGNRNNDNGNNSGRTPANAGIGNGNGYGNANNGNVNNGNGNNGNINNRNGNNANGNNGNANNGNNRAKPAPGQYPGRPVGPRNFANNANGNARPAQPGSNGNTPKPKPKPGQGSPDNHDKPEHNNPQDHR